MARVCGLVSLLESSKPGPATFSGRTDGMVLPVSPLRRAIRAIGIAIGTCPAQGGGLPGGCRQGVMKSWKR